MLIKYIKPQQPHAMQQRRILCTMTPMSQHHVSSTSDSSILKNHRPTAIAPTQIHNRYILNQHRATFAVPQLSEETYQQLQKLFDRNNAAIEVFTHALPSMQEQNLAIWRYTFYGEKLNIEKLSALEELVQRELKTLNRLNTHIDSE